MRSIFALVLLFIFGIAVKARDASANAKLETPEWAAGLKDSDYSRLLSQVKALQKHGSRTYFKAEAQPFAEALRPLAPKLIVVRRDSVEFFLNSDLDNPQILRFWRLVGVWAPNAVLWIADLRSPAQTYESRLWEVKETLSETDLEAERQLSSLEEALKKDTK